jgi:hypothetical protein
VNAEQFGSPMLRAVLIRTSEIEAIVVGLPESHRDSRQGPVACRRTSFKNERAARAGAWRFRTFGFG